jgi:hypothetical protein
VLCTIIRSSWNSSTDGVIGLSWTSSSQSDTMEHGIELLDWLDGDRLNSTALSVLESRGERIIMRSINQLLLTNYLYTQSELYQRNHISIHHIHGKNSTNSHLRSILYIHTKQDTSASIMFIENTLSTSTYGLFYAHTKRVGSNKIHQHPSYSLKAQYQHLLTGYFMHAQSG